MKLVNVLNIVLIFVLMLSPCLVYADDLTSDSAISGGSVNINVLEAPTLMSVNVSNERVSASDSNGFKSVMLGLIGDYETIVTDYTYQSSSGYTTHSIEIEKDWSWILSCVMFIVVVYCTFRIIGGLFTR